MAGVLCTYFYLPVNIIAVHSITTNSMGIKYSSNENFFKKWTPSMAYLLGLIYADGSLEDATYLRGRYIRLSSTDKSIISSAKNVLSSEHKIVLIKPINPKWKIRYLIRIGSHEIYNDLVMLGLYPNKSLTMEFPNMPKKYLSHFTRGYFDGDGHVSVEKQGESLKKLKVIFVSGSLNFLLELSDRLDKELNLKIKKVYSGSRAYRLAYSTSDSVKIFKYIYKDANGEYLPRKFAIFKKFFLEYNKWADKEVLRTLEYGAMVK